MCIFAAALRSKGGATLKRNAAASRSFHTKKSGKGRREPQKSFPARRDGRPPVQWRCQVQTAAGQRVASFNDDELQEQQRGTSADKAPRKRRNGSEHCPQGEPACCWLARIHAHGYGWQHHQRAVAFRRWSFQRCDGPTRAQPPGVAPWGAPMTTVRSIIQRTPL